MASSSSSLKGVSSDTFGEYKGYAMAGLGGLLATVLSYEALVLAPKRAEELNRLKGKLKLSPLDSVWRSSTANLDPTILYPILNVRKIVNALNSGEDKKSLKNLLAIQEVPIAQAMKTWKSTDRIAQEGDYEKALAAKYGHDIAALWVHLDRVLGSEGTNGIIQPWKDHSTYLKGELTNLIECKKKN